MKPTVPETGTVAGHAAGRYFNLPSLDVVSGFVMLLLMSFLSFRRLRKLDHSSSLEIRENVSEHIFDPDVTLFDGRDYTGYTGCS